MRSSVLTAALLVCLSLSACGAEGDGGEVPSARTALSPLGQAADLEAEAALLTVGGETVPAWQYLYWLAADCRALEERYAAAGERPDWTAALPEGGTLREAVRDAALMDTALCATVAAWAKQYGCALSQEEIDALPPQTHPWLTESQCRQLARLGQEYAALFALYCQEGSPLAPTEAALAAFKADCGLLSAERVFIPLGSDADAARETAGAAFAALNTARDPDAVFRRLMETHGGGPLSDTDWLPALREAAEMLAVGQWSGVLAAGDGYSILRRTALPRQTLLEAHFDRLLQNAAAAQDIRVTGDYAAIDPQGFWQALRETAGA